MDTLYLKLVSVPSWIATILGCHQKVPTLLPTIIAREGTWMRCAELIQLVLSPSPLS